jgi:hypothetical protein
MDSSFYEFAAKITRLGNRGVKKALISLLLLTLAGCYKTPQDFYDYNMKDECAKQTLYYDPLTGNCVANPR